MEGILAGSGADDGARLPGSMENPLPPMAMICGVSMSDYYCAILPPLKQRSLSGPRAFVQRIVGTGSFEIFAVS